MSVKDTLPEAGAGVMCTPDWVLTALAAALRDERQGNTERLRGVAALVLARVRWMRLQLPEGERGQRQADYGDFIADRALLRIAAWRVLDADAEAAPDSPWVGGAVSLRDAEAALRTLIKRLDARHDASPGRAGGGAGPAKETVVATGPAHTTGEDPL